MTADDHLLGQFFFVLMEVCTSCFSYSILAYCLVWKFIKLSAAAVLAHFDIA